VRHVYIVTYDIANPKRLRRVFKTMKGFGKHLQFSVFQCDLPAIDLIRMQDILTMIINAEEDQVLIFNLGPTESCPIKSIQTIGLPAKLTKRATQVV